MLLCIDFRKRLRELARLVEVVKSGKLSREEASIAVYSLKEVDRDFLERTSTSEH